MSKGSERGNEGGDKDARKERRGGKGGCTSYLAKRNMSQPLPQPNRERAP